MKLNYSIMLSALLMGAALVGCTDNTATTQQKTVVTINELEGKDVICRDIYGHFSEHLGHCIYGGLWVGEDSQIPNVAGVRKDILDGLKEIKIPNLRWPGGCFADEYHWEDGIGPKASRPSMINTHWGGVTEDNSFGTHEFLNMCEYLGTEPYICANVGSSTVREISQWVEYMTFNGKSPMADLRRQNGREEPWKVKYLGIGNETWGCGGNMTPEHYADVCRQYATYARNYPDNELFKIGVGANSDDYNWTEVVMKNAGGYIKGLSLHHYSWDHNVAVEFDDEGYYSILARAYMMDEVVSKHSAIMDKYDPAKRVGLMVDEWGSWYKVEEGTNPGFLFQQNTMRDAILAGMTLNIFNNHCDRVKMSNIAQLVNVLQALFLTDGEKMIKTPTFHIYNMYKVHQDATLLPSTVLCAKTPKNTPDVSVSASKDSEGKIHVSIVNLDLVNDKDVECSIVSERELKAAGGEILASADIHDHNTFDNPEVVGNKPFSDYTVENDVVNVKIPARSIVTLCLE